MTNMITDNTKVKGNYYGAEFTGTVISSRCNSWSNLPEYRIIIDNAISVPKVCSYPAGHEIGIGGCSDDMNIGSLEVIN